jgi:hypothetical protein
MTNTTTKTKRPSSITLISIFEIYGGVLLFYFIFSPGIQSFVQERGVGETIFYGFSGLVLIISGIGFWLMRKWAVYTLIGLTLISQAYLLAVGRWNIFSLLIPAVLIFVGYKHLSKMN